VLYCEALYSAVLITTGLHLSNLPIGLRLKQKTYLVQIQPPDLNMVMRSLDLPKRVSDSQLTTNTLISQVAEPTYCVI
jgi:hypothetical protein